ncbi:hypothetical protein ACH5RR_012302 [Cinchona calisaya]|uniref:Aminotransferase-like plant mobile domain-containing protein n=1 Tax=Cinchona calisaya TaxID=153742 RepID=A0ABD3A7C6_9GENT
MTSLTILEPLSFSRFGTLSFPTLLGRMQGDNITWAFRSFNIFGQSFTRSMSWIFWVKFTLHEYKEALKLVKIYKAVELSLFSYPRGINVFKALLERWSSSTNTFHTLYGGIGISLLDIQKIGGLPSSGEFYDECNPSNEMLGSKHIPQATIDLYDLNQALGAKPSFQAWIDNFIILILNHPNSNALGFQKLEDFPFECKYDYPRNTCWPSPGLLVKWVYTSIYAV